MHSAGILAADDKRRVVLVMHGFDVRRARALFESAGLEVIPAPTQVVRFDELEVADFLPRAGALATVHFALYELAALLREALRNAW